MEGSSVSRNDRSRLSVREHRDRLKQNGLRQSAIWLPEELHDWIAQLVDAGKYPNRSAAIQAVLEPVYKENSHAKMK